jgi:curved DNA-binding protein CbpA
LLGVSPTATEEVLGEAWKKLIIESYGKSNSEIEKEKRKRLGIIMNILTNPEKRREYDLQIGLNVSPNKQVEKEEKIVTIELETILFDLLMILGDSDRIIKLNSYEWSIVKDISDYVIKIQNEVIE